MPKLTGADYIIALASEAAEAGRPFADEFRMMVEAAILGNDVPVSDMTASRPLEEDEATAVGVLVSAYQMALQRSDAESLYEVIRFGMALLAKWAEYLAVIDEHPRMVLADD